MPDGSMYTVNEKRINNMKMLLEGAEIFFSSFTDGFAAPRYLSGSTTGEMANFAVKKLGCTVLGSNGQPTTIEKYKPGEEYTVIGETATVRKHVESALNILRNR